ncbi:MAG TPA: glycosyltransferase [Steroidobacteraceae bacterium]
MISLVISSLGVGGAQVWVDRLARLLAPHFDVEVLYGGLYGGISFEDASKLATGLNIRKIRGLHVPFNPFAVVGAYRYLRARKDSLVIVSSFVAGVTFRLAAMLTGHTIYYVSHGWSFRYQRFPGSLLARCAEAFLGRFSRIICISRADLEVARGLLRIPRGNLTLIRNRILDDSIRTSDASGRAATIGKALYVGRMADPKRFDLYVELSRRFPRIEFHAVGPTAGDFATVPPSIVLHGRVPAFNRYEDYDVFCLFSNSEGLPMSALEAHVHAVPLLLSNVGGCAELIHGNGLLVENSVEDIVAKFTALDASLPAYRREALRQRRRFMVSPAALIRLVGRALRRETETT